MTRAGPEQSEKGPARREVGALEATIELGALFKDQGWSLKKRLELTRASLKIGVIEAHNSKRGTPVPRGV
jgi:hypothetical protein